MYNFQLETDQINDIQQVLNKSDGVIAFPTDTVWGVGCLVENKPAVEKIYSLKGRSKNKPLILLGSKTEYLVPYVDKIHSNAQKIIEKYFPGAVTLVLPKSNLTPDYITSGMNTVGIRIPDYPPLLELLEKCSNSHVLATTSANISEMGATSSKKTVEETIGKDIDYILDEFGYSPKGTESTVVSVDRDGNIKILRQGAIIIDI